MSNPNYTLDIISHHPHFKNKSLRKYNVEGIETIGAWGDEPFEVVFKNNTWQKVQVKLSIDGTDVLTGKPANTEVNSDMWVVNGYGTLSLKAWPETSNGGAQFIFTSASNSVAVHTHGNLSSRGIIAAAVFTEGYVEPARINHNYYHWYNQWDLTYPTFGGSYTYGDVGINSISDCSLSDDISFNSCNASDTRVRETKSLQSLAAVGAGQYVNQKITHTTGLIKPTLAETVRVRYLWWDELVAKLRQFNVPAPHASGFPGDHKQHVMSIGNTPRIGTPTYSAPEPVYSRI